jgi:hypothetical protein
MSIQHKQTLKEDLILRGIKILDFAYIIPIYTLGGLLSAIFLDNYVYKNIKFVYKDNIKDETDVELMINTIILLFITTVVAYILRNVLQKIPFPLENVYGFKHLQVTEVKYDNIMMMILLIFSNEIGRYIVEIQRRFVKNNNINNNNNNKS